MDRSDIVIVVSHGELKPQDIIRNIIELNGGAPAVEEITIASNSVSTYPCTLKTKYYENTIALIPCEGNIQTVSPELFHMAEGLIVYFDADDKSFVDQIPSLCDILQNNNIGLGILLTNKLYEESSHGLTFRDVKQSSNFLFDVIEVSADADGHVCDDDHPEAEECRQYSELVNTLHNYLWSNMECRTNCTEQRRDSDCSDLDAVDSQLELFEGLLTSIQNFKKVSSTLDRETVLDNAEKLAEVFAKIINEN